MAYDELTVQVIAEAATLRGEKAELKSALAQKDAEIASLKEEKQKAQRLVGEKSRENAGLLEDLRQAREQIYHLADAIAQMKVVLMLDGEEESDPEEIINQAWEIVERALAPQPAPEPDRLTQLERVRELADICCPSKEYLEMFKDQVGGRLSFEENICYWRELRAALDAVKGGE